jgi:hypothetical protein
MSKHGMILSMCLAALNLGHIAVAHAERDSYEKDYYTLTLDKVVEIPSDSDQNYDQNGIVLPIAGLGSTPAPAPTTTSPSNPPVAPAAPAKPTAGTPVSVPPIVTPVTPPTNSTTPLQNVVNTLQNVSTAVSDLSNILNFGKAIWTVIQDNQPVANVTLNTANAIPEAAKTWDSLQGWSAPQTRTFQATYKNTFDMTMVTFVYKIVYTYAGNSSGVGQFLSGVSVIPSTVNVAWGVTFNADVNVPNVTNVGTQANPVAAMQVQLHWTVKTIDSHIEKTNAYYIRGDGPFSQLN